MRLADNRHSPSIWKWDVPALPFPVSENGKEAPCPIYRFRSRRITATIKIPQNRKKTVDTFPVAENGKEAPCSIYRFRFRKITATIRIPQNRKKTVDTTKTGIQPIVKTSVNASAVTMPPPMKGSWSSCL